MNELRTFGQTVKRRRESGAVLIAALIVIVILAFIAATVTMNAMPAYRGTFHGSSWHEAKLAADAGVEYAMSEIQKCVPKPNNYTWPGWVLADGSPVPPGSNA